VAPGPGAPFAGRGELMHGREPSHVQAMSPSRPPIPSRSGVGPSCVALPAGPWPSVLAYLSERFAQVTAPQWAARMARGEVLDEQGQPLPVDAPYQPQRKVYYFRHVPGEAPVPFDEVLLYQDEHLVVADKPHFLPTTPSGRHAEQTLLARLKHKLGIDTLSPLHRLDRETAGVVVFTVQPAERDRYHALFRERAVHKVYEAVAPALPALAGATTRRSRVLESAHSFMQMHEVPGEPNAHTQIECLARLPSTGLAHSLAQYRLQPLTGQRHQLRVHMAALGAPIVGDRIYPVLQPVAAPDDFSQPLQLLARRIAFCDPVTGQPRVFESGRVLASLGGGALP
jgi:tRNA pseudouridine32 synthase / 23S rRNA pseudouridine746 synthase